MWLLISALAAAIATALWYSKAEDDKYMLRFLSLMLWGATIMIFVDRAMGYFMEGGEFLEVTVEATILGVSMVIAALVVWEVALLLKDPKGVIYKKGTSVSERQPKS